MKRPEYGIDAPGVIRNLLICCLIAILLPVFYPVITIGGINIYTFGFIYTGITCGLTGIWMLLYSVYGKLKHRDRMLNYINWRGDEKVLDIGTGRGLLAIGAAKRLTTGRSYGIDIWKADDLTKNKLANTLSNVVAEGVNDKIEIVNEDACDMSFSDNAFDVVLSNLCLHNISKAADRKKACSEVYRVMKKGGTGIISDFIHIKEYRKNFEELGMQTEIKPASFPTTFPPLKILVIKKKF